MNTITIRWHGHSCFTITAGGYSIVLDPYAPDSVPGLPRLSLAANQVLCSHGHRDHNAAELVTVSACPGESPFRIYKIDTFHDDAGGSLRGETRIHILEACGLRIAHMGDLGCELKPEQLEQLKNLDAIMIPVGGHFTIGAAQAKALVTKLSPRVVIPMHYRSDSFGYPVIGRLEEYTGLCSDVVEYNCNTLILDPDTKPQTAVLAME